MKILGVVLLVFAALNLFVAIAAASYGAADAAGQKMSATLLLALTGALLLYFSNRKKKEKVGCDKQEEREINFSNEPLDTYKNEPQRQFDKLAINNFLGFAVNVTSFDEIVEVLQQHDVDYSEFPDYSDKDNKEIVFSYETGAIVWSCNLKIKKNKLGFISLHNYSPNSYETYKILCEEMSERFNSSHNINISINKREGTETTTFVNKEDVWSFTEIEYDSSPIIGQKKIYIRYF